MATADDLANPRWRLSNLYWIIDKDGQRVLFKPNWAQQQYLDNLHNRNIILKARQLGFTTLSCLMYLDHCIFNSNTSAAVIAHKLDDAKEIFRTKIKYPYEQLPEALRNAVPLTQDAADSLEFANNSKIRVSTSTRSGTVQFLHISEYGKICSQYPEKAREIKTGAIPSAERGVITIESTAEGQEGDFYDRCMISMQQEGRDISRLDYKFHFFPWWGHPEYELKQSVVPEGPEDRIYFERLEAQLGIEVTQPKRNWWLSQERDLGGDMKREYPANPQEAFEAAIEGAYFSDALAIAQKHDRIGDFQIDPGLPVNTAWDIGHNDFNVIWLWQDRSETPTFIGCYYNSGEYIGHYIDWLNEWKRDHGIQFGKHYLPHDGDRASIWLPAGTIDVMQKLGFTPDIVQRTKNRIESIQNARRRLAHCQFDEAKCKDGLKYLKMYRKEWNDKLGVWRDKPLHDDASHFADAFRTFSESGHMPQPSIITKRERYRSSSSAPTGSHMSA